MFKKMEDLLIRVELLFCEVLIVILVLVVFMNAVLRLFNRPLNWSTDVAQLIFTWISFVGADLALKKSKHSGVDIIARNLPANIHRVVKILMYVLLIGFLAVLGHSGANLAVLNISRKFHSMPLTYSSVTFAVPVGCVLLIITCLRKLAALIWKTADPYRDVLEDPVVQEEEEVI